MNKKVHVKTGDTVIIISGRERGKQGKVLAVSPEEGKVIIEGRNMVTQACQAPPYGRAGRHREGRGRHVCLQGAARLPALRQADPRAAQGAFRRGRRQAEARF